MGRLPEGAVMVADANFGVFSVAYAAAQQERPVVLRLTKVRASIWRAAPCRTASTGQSYGGPPARIAEPIRTAGRRVCARPFNCP